MSLAWRGEACACVNERSKGVSHQYKSRIGFNDYPTAKLPTTTNCSSSINQHNYSTAAALHSRRAPTPPSSIHHQHQQTSTTTGNRQIKQIKSMPPARFDINGFLDRLIGSILEGRLREQISLDDILRLLSAVRRIFQTQPMLLRIDAPVIICGDLHGQFNDLVRMLNSEGFPNVRNYLFLGDYVDRGTQNLELILFMFACKIRYPRNFFMLRGNHETTAINRVYGFHGSLMAIYQSQSLYDSFQRVFEWMPLSCLVSNRILCMHGGLSPQLMDAETIDVLNTIPRPLNDQQITTQKNPMAVDLLWADPDVNVRLFAPNHRGIGSIFGRQVIDRVRQKFGIDLIIRAHQVVLDGYEFFNGTQTSGLITIFTAPHYCGMFDNSGAIVRVSGDLGLTFKVFRPNFVQQAATQQNATQTARIEPNQQKN